ncbi:hypothetical protein [Gordonia alkanivorans]|uniref:hypothetical protein n=1 Tax=Gordonia alkanivorans TaxID=84096 RepID=UPI002446A55C|nr:hypothetical protein [Gordonia alkanivorans]MDH3006248.1 hypothetical protein [Gordonia alkanivorans]MDH3014005.1 hypothetical protein [Gordonia alkanivorans]MDH3042688.1 hypothetical protein [Gordonia alkanivorans]
MTPAEFLAAQQATLDAATRADERVTATCDPRAHDEFWRLWNEFWTREAHWGHRVG